MTPDFSFQDGVPLEEMGTFEGALVYTLLLAVRWGRIGKTPADKQVWISEFQIVEDRVVQPGVCLLVARGSESSPQWVLTDCDFEDCSVAGVAEALLAALNKVLQPGEMKR